VVLYEPEGGTKVYQVEILETDVRGEVVLYVGGMPILYLCPKSRSVRLVPNDVDEDTGLIFGEVYKYVQVRRDKTR
jgi:hypothetical protein